MRAALLPYRQKQMVNRNQGTFAEKKDLKAVLEWHDLHRE